jgi:hypothetical protein
VNSTMLSFIVVQYIWKMAVDFNNLDAALVALLPFSQSYQFTSDVICGV